jgi:hypothetical protein
VFAERRHVQCVFVRRVGLRFGNGLRRTYDFLNVVLAVVFVVFVLVICMLARRFLRTLVLLMELLLVFFVLLDFGLSPFVNFFFLFFDFVFLKNRAAGSRSGRNFLANQILFGFDDAGGKQFGFFFADVHFRSGFRFGGARRSFFVLVRLRGCRASDFVRKIFGDGLIRFRGFDAFGGSAGEKPTGQTAARTARSVCWSRLAGNARLRFVRFNLRFEAFRLRDWSTCGGFRNWPPAILCERFARQYKRFLGRVRWASWRGSARSIAAIIEVTPWTTIVTAAIRIAAAASAISTAVSATIRATVAAARVTLWRSVLGWGKIACAAALAETAATATAASASATATKSAPSAASAKLWPVASVATAIASAITAAARAITWRRAVLGGVVARSKILRSGLVRIRLTLFFAYVAHRLSFVNAWSAGFRFFDVCMNVVRFGIAV